MKEALKKQFYVQWRDWVGMTMVILGGGVFGMLLHFMITRLDHTVTTYFALGTVIAGLVAVLCGAIMIITYIGIYFNLEVSMGCTRIQFFVSYYIVSFLFCAFYTGVLILFYLAENALEKRLYPDLSCEIDYLPYLLKWGVPVAAAFCILACFCGVLMLRYGRKAFWVFWGIWMVGCIGIPQICSAVEEAPDSLFGKIGNAFAGVLRSIPGNVIIGFIVVLCFLGLAVSWFYIRKQQVVS